MVWYLEMARKANMVSRVAGTWEFEKLCQVVEGLANARDELLESAVGDSVNDLSDSDIALYEGLYDAYRNICKLTLWLAGNPSNYREDTTELAFKSSGQMMRSHVEFLLRPVFGVALTEGG